MHLTAEVFANHADNLIRDTPQGSAFVRSRRFQALFGVSPLVCAIAWNKVRNNAPKNSKPIHLLWALLFLKQYSNEHGNHSVTGADEKTFRKWSWIFVHLLADLTVIKWGKRLIRNSNQTIFATVDGTDYRINEPAPFDPKWFSHKFRSAGLRYEIGISIRSGDIVWANGPFPCGSWSDLRIFRYSMKSALLPTETVIADGTYKDPKCEKEGSSPAISKMNAIARARHETVNRRMKQFGVLGQRFRHNMRKHSPCFHAVANLTQLMIENGHPLFTIRFSN